MRYADDNLLELAISVVAAYGTYLLADRLNESGSSRRSWWASCWATATRRRPLFESTREALDVVWEFISFMLTALTFLFMGLAISTEQLLDAVPTIVAGVFAITAARAFVVYVVIGGGEPLLPRRACSPCRTCT